MKISKRMSPLRYDRIYRNYFKIKYSRYGREFCCCGDHESSHNGYNHNHLFVSQVDWCIQSCVKREMKNIKI